MSDDLNVEDHDISDTVVLKAIIKDLQWQVNLQRQAIAKLRIEIVELQQWKERQESYQIEQNWKG